MVIALHRLNVRCPACHAARRLSALAILACVAAAGAAVGSAAEPSVRFQPVQRDGKVLGFDVRAGEKLAAPIRLSSGGLLTARRAEVVTGASAGLRLSGLEARPGTGLTLGGDDFVEIRRQPDRPYPEVRFRLTIAHFDPQAWEKGAGRFPFHFLTLSMPGAEVFHQRGWLMATPHADPFPLLLDPHAGTSEIASGWSRNWSYAVPIGAYPIPVVGLWAPSQRLYAAYDFMPSRLAEQSERYLASAYCWQQGADGQFVTLVYPYGGRGYQTLAYPQPGTVLEGRFRLVLATNLASTDDPNTLLQEDYFQRFAGQFPPAPPMNDLSWLPGGTRLAGLPGATRTPLVIRLKDGNPYEEPGTTEIDGWTWHRESTVRAAFHRHDHGLLDHLRSDIALLAQSAQRVTIDGEACLFWPKPLSGKWRESFGGEAVKTLHNANGWSAGIALIDFYRHDKATGSSIAESKSAGYLPLIDGVYNWTRHFVWTRNEFADVPSSPFAIGGTLSAAFLLDYYFAFHDDPVRRQRAQEAVELARKITYRYMVAWAGDNDRDDRLDSAFLWEPNSGRDWTGTACANEVHWNLDTLTQVYVNCGDPILLYYLRGALERWHLLYREMYFDAPAQYPHNALSEWLGLFDGTMAGRGGRANFGTADMLPMNEPVGGSLLRVTCGSRAAVACCKNGVHSRIENYRCAGEGHFSFTVRTTRAEPIDVTVSFPYSDLMEQPVALGRAGTSRTLAGNELQRSPDSPSYVYVRQVRDGDVITVGRVPPETPVLAIDCPWTAHWGENAEQTEGRWRMHALKGAEPLPNDWNDTGSYAGLWPGRHHAWGIPLEVAADGTGRPLATAEPCDIQLSPGMRSLMAEIYVFFTPLSPQATVRIVEASSGTVTKGLEDAALAWTSWPPCFHQKIAIVTASVPLASHVSITASNARVLAVTSLASDLEAERVGRFWRQGVAQYAAESAAEQRAAALATLAADVPDGRIAILPAQALAGPVVNMLHRCGLMKRCRVLKPAELLDPDVFNPRRLRVLLNLDGEEYSGTIRRDGDGAEAILGYLRAGGKLAMLTSQPLPFCYDSGLGPQVGRALTHRMGFPVGFGFETPPTDDLEMRVNSGQNIVTGLPARIPFFKEGDLRLRVVRPQYVSHDARYTPIVSVVQASGSPVGDAAGYAEFQRGPMRGAALLYIWSGLLMDRQLGPPMIEQALRWVMAEGKK